MRILWASRRAQKESCPAFGQECLKCHDFNHFQSMCDSLKKKLPVKQKPVHLKGPKKQVHKHEFADDTDESDDNYFTYTMTMADQDKVHSAHAVSNRVHATTLIQGQEVMFKLDTGATCNIIPGKVLETMPTPQPTNDLKMYNGSTMNQRDNMHWRHKSEKLCYVPNRDCRYQRGLRTTSR